jgi:uncharacterized protein
LIYSSTRIETELGSKYILKLCRHFAHKVPARFTDWEGQVQFLQGQCLLKADARGLDIHLQAESAEQVQAMHAIIDDHLRRFARMETLSYHWVDGAPQTIQPALLALRSTGLAP